MVIWVTEQELETFELLIPEDMREYVKTGEWFCLGALLKDSAGEEYTAAGVLLFSDEEGISGGEEELTVITLNWIYVTGECRNRGIGNALMQEFSEVLENIETGGIICDLPFDSEYDQAEAFLISWGFDFAVISGTEMIITKEDFRRRLLTLEEEKLKMMLEGYEEPEDICLIDELPEPVFEEALREIRDVYPLGYYDMLSENKADYDEEMSAAFLVNNQVSSMVLFERLPGGDPHMLLLAGVFSQKTRELFTLLTYAAGRYYRFYPEETSLRLTLNTEQSMNLAVRLFPEQEPRLIRRGVFSY